MIKIDGLKWMPIDGGRRYRAVIDGKLEAFYCLGNEAIVKRFEPLYDEHWIINGVTLTNKLLAEQYIKTLL